MTTLKLYKGVVFDGVNSFPDIPTKAAFDAYLAAKQQYSQTVQYNRIGEPILIQKGYDVAISYSYGCIDTGTKKYFIIPDSINVNENGRVYLTYSVDWYTTLKYDSKISFGRSHLIKSTGVDPLTYPQSIQPIDMRIKTYEALKSEITVGDKSYNQELIILYTDPSETGTMKWAFSAMVNNATFLYTDNKRGLLPDDIYDGKFLPLLGTPLPPDNVLGIFFLPIAPHTGASHLMMEYEYTAGIFIRAYEFPLTVMNGWASVSLTTPITTTPTKIGVITDPMGNIIYTVPYGRTITSVNFSVIASLSQCYIRLEFDPDLPDDVQNAENSSVLYACDKIDYISDAYKNWASGLKGIEIEERRIQKNKNLVSGVGNSAITGAIGGASGNPIGAAVGVVGGVAGAVLSYATDTYYESKVNVLEDRKYQLAQDTMVPGSFVGPGFFHAVQLEAPVSDIARYNDEISNFGADCNLPLVSWTPSPGAYKFADVEVIADVPYGIKQNIKQKLISGIKIVDVT